MLEAAREMVDEAGIGAITMRKLADRASVSVQSVYNLIGDRDQLISLLIDEELSRLGAEFTAVKDENSLRRLRAQYMLFVDSAISHTRRPLTLAVLNDAALTERFFTTWRSNTMMEKAIRQAVRDGYLKDDVSPTALAEHVRGGLLHVLRLWAADLLTDDQLRTKAAFGLDIALLAICQDSTRTLLLHGFGKRRTTQKSPTSTPDNAPTSQKAT